MSALLAKLFPGASSSSSSNSVASGQPIFSDLNSMEALCKAINDLSTETPENAGIKAAELTRKNKDIFEKKTNDIEAFLLHCNPAVGSAAFIAAIKAMFDTSFAKNYEAGTDRAVELLKHYLDGKQLVAAHLRLVPELIFPLVRNVGFYCLEKKKEAEIGETIVISALSMLFPRDDPSATIYITSCHSALFACTLKTKHYALAEPFIEERVEAVYNELGVDETENEAPNQAETPQTPAKQPSSSSAKNYEKDAVKAAKAKIQNSPPPQAVPYFDPKHVFQYLYFGALILIELKQYQRALVLLETCVSIPAYQPNDHQLDAYKKFLLISLLLNGYATDIADRSPSVTRLLKTKTGDYRFLLEVKFMRGKNTHGAFEAMALGSKDKFEKDQNWKLVKLIVEEMKRKAVLAVSKIYSSLRIADVKELANLKNDAESMSIIEDLVNSGRLDVKFDKENNSVIWNELSPEIGEDQVETATKIIDRLNTLLEEKNVGLKVHPVIAARNAKSSVLYNDDEGLSMNPLDT